LVVTLKQPFVARQPEVCTSLQNIVLLGDDAADGRLTQPSALGHVELCWVLAPILKCDQDMVFYSQIRRSAWLFLCSLDFSADDFAHPLESLRLDAAISFEVCGRQGFDVFVAHQLVMSETVQIVNQHL